MYKEFNISDELIKRAELAEQEIKPVFEQIDKIQEYNQLKVLKAFTDEHIAPAHFAPSYGYGYDDIGRDKLELLFARIFKAECACVRPQIASGTHALALALQGIAKKGDRILSASGTPYDTLEGIIGAKENQPFSLTDMGASYSSLSLKNGRIDFEALKKAAPSADIIMLQRSRGYQPRPSLTIDDIALACKTIKSVNADAIIFVDNCYGEFVEEKEPCEVGADIIAGSLIKNPGGGIAPTGGYIAGKKELIDRVFCRLTAPGIGGEVGSYAAGYLPFYQGLYLAPQAVANALKGAVFTAKMLESYGYEVSPCWNEKRGCIIQSVRLFNEENIVSFCRALQKNSPIDSFVTPEPWAMPGYKDKVIMAAGTFIQGASIELSGDAPIREPFVLYMQGGLVYAQVKIAVLCALSEMRKL